MKPINSSSPASMFLNLTPAVLVAFTIAALAAEPPRSIALIIIFLISAVSLQLSGWIAHRTRSRALRGCDEAEKGDEEKNQNQDNTYSSEDFFNDLNALMKPQLFTIRVFFASSLILILTLMIRLFSVGHFGGDANLLDYGPKISKNGPAGKTNIAFEEFDFDTFGHLVQGFLAGFLSYPATVGTISKIAATFRGFVLSSMNRTRQSSKSLLLVKPCMFSLCILQLLQACVTIYPFYSMVKRLRYTSFSQTSHVNNTTEWCLGNILGVSVGCFVTAILQRHLILGTEIEESRKTHAESLEVNQTELHGIVIYGFGKASDYEIVTRFPNILNITRILSFVILGLFSVTTFLTGLFLGLSWNYDEKDSAVNGGMVALFVCINVAAYTAFFFLSR